MGGGGGSSKGGGLTDNQKRINEITLARLEREETKVVEDEAERQRLLSAGRFGRTSLLTGGFLGPGSTSRVARAVTRGNEQKGIVSKATRGRRTAARTAAKDAAKLAKKGKKSNYDLQKEALQRAGVWSGGADF